MASGEPQYFKQARAAGKVVVSDPPKFDLESYIANYRGKTRILRLLHIGRTSSYLGHEALKLAVTEAKEGKDVGLYERVAGLLHEIAPEDADTRLDNEWVERTKREVAAETTRLDGELKGYKNNLIKESIRMGYDDMGRHYQQIGLLSEAAKAFNKEREYCQLPAHIAIMVNRLINVYIEQESWLSVETNVQKLRALPQKPSESAKIEAKLSAALGLAELATGSFKKAALTLIECNPRMVQARLEEATSEEATSEVMSPNDIATYGALCALASMDRAELQTRVLENSKFRNYLELEPHLRRAISSFVAGKYAQCLEILESYRTDYLLDLYLSPHYDRLFSLIRNKAIVQYFVPFSCATFKALAMSFNTSEDTIVETLADLIKSESLPASLDIEKGILVANKVDSRGQMYKNAITAARDYERTLYLRLFRAGVLDAGIDVRPPNQKSGFAGPNGSDILMGIDPNARGKGKGAARPAHF